MSARPAGHFAAIKLLTVFIRVSNPPVRRLQVVYMPHNHLAHSVGAREMYASCSPITTYSFHVTELPFLLGASSPQHLSGSNL